MSRITARLFPRLPLLLALAAVVLGACGAPDDGAIAGSASIQFLAFGDAVEAAGYTALVAAFQVEHPEVDVTFTPVAKQDDLLAKLTTSFAGGAPPDVFLINFRKYGQFAEQGLLHPVQDLLDASEVVTEDDLFQAPLEAFRFDGDAITCLPQNVSSLVAYINTDLFQAAGVDLPLTGWTYAEFLAAAQAITDTEADVYGLGTEPSLIRMAPFIWEQGGEVVDDQDAPTTLTLDQGVAREAVERFLDLQDLGVVPDDRAEQAEESESRFLNGRLGIYLDSRKATPTMRTITDFAWDVAPLPVDAGQTPTTMLHSDAYCLSESDNVDAAWTFTEFAMSVEGQTILAESGRTVPSRRDVANSSAFLDPNAGPANAQVFIDNADRVRATPHTATWTKVEKQADTILEEMYYGRLGRDEGFRRLIDETTPLFRSTS